MVGKARWAVTAVFAVNGLTIATFAVRTPSLKLEHGLSDGGLGGMAALFGIAAVATMQLAGRVAARTGSGPLLRVAAVLLPAVLVALGTVRGDAGLVVAMLALGTVNGALDVGMNAHAVAVERVLGRPVLNGCHAAWSIGAVAGSVAGGAAAGAGASLAVHFSAVAVVLLPAAIVAGRWLLPPSADRTDRAAAAGERRARGGRWPRRLVVLGVMGTTVLTCETGVLTWSGVLLHEHHGASLGVAALGFVAFTACQTAGRLVGDRVLSRLTPPVLVRAGTATAALGLVVALASPWPALAVAGFGVMGAGLATPLPVLFGVVGRLGGPQGRGAAVNVSRFTTMTYAGILLGPAAIGRVADVAGLAWTLGLLVPALAAVAVAAGAATATGDPAPDPAPEASLSRP